MNACAFHELKTCASAPHNISLRRELPTPGPYGPLDLGERCCTILPCSEIPKTDGHRVPVPQAIPGTTGTSNPPAEQHTQGRGRSAEEGITEARKGGPRIRGRGPPRPGERGVLPDRPRKQPGILRDDHPRGKQRKPSKKATRAPVRPLRLDGLVLLLLLDLEQQGPVDVGQDAAEGDGGADEGVELLVAADGELQVAGRDALDLEILGGVLRGARQRGVRARGGGETPGNSRLPARAPRPSDTPGRR